MVARQKKKSNNNKAENEEENPETGERKRLKRLAHSSNIVSEAPVNGFSPLSPSKTVIKHHGKDIIKKSQRKNRYLFSFSGLLAPISGGKIGSLTDLGSKNPILYLEFPQGRMKLFGTIVYPKNRYLTLQFSRGGKNVMCEDYFDTMILFSEAYWVGKKDENPAEARLDFPEELYEKKQIDFDFKGGAGVGAGAVAGAGQAVKQNKIVKKAAAKAKEEESLSDSPLDEMDAESPETQDIPLDIEYSTPVRHSERTAGKRFKFTEVSSGDDSAGSADEMSAKENDEASENNQNPCTSKTAVEVSNSEDIQPSTVQPPQSSMLSSGRKKSSHGSLVQATISTLFKKVGQKSTTEDTMKAVPTSTKVAQRNSSKSKNKSVPMQLVPDAAELPKENISQVRKAGATSDSKKRKAEAAEVEDEIEDFSSAFEDGDENDDDRCA